MPLFRWLGGWISGTVWVGSCRPSNVSSVICSDYNQLKKNSTFPKYYFTRPAWVRRRWSLWPLLIDYLSTRHNVEFQSLCFANRMSERTHGRPKGPLPKDVAATRQLLGMTEESIRRDVSELTQWLHQQPDLPNALAGGERSSTQHDLRQIITKKKNTTRRPRSRI